MASFIFLTPPDGAEGSERSIAIRDGFAFFAFLCPPLWFLVHRLWFEAVFSGLFLALASALSNVPALATSGPALGPALWLAGCLFAGLEGRNLLIHARQRQGFRLAAALEARNLAQAEEIFFYNAAPAAKTPVNPALSGPAHGGDSRPVLGLFDLHGGR